MLFWQVLFSFLLGQHPCWAAKYRQVPRFRLLVPPKLPWALSHILDNSPIPQIGCCPIGKLPVSCREVHLAPHSRLSFRYSPHTPLCNTITLWVIAYCRFNPDPSSSTERLHHLVQELPSTIKSYCSKPFSFSILLAFCLCNNHPSLDLLDNTLLVF